MSHYLGFWTFDYLSHKIQKLNSLQGRERLILLVNRNLACTGSEFQAQAENLLFYDRKIPHLEIIKILRRYEGQQQAEEIERLKGMEISFESGAGVIELQELAREYGVGLEALREVIKGRKDLGYALLGDQLVSRQVLEAVREELVGVKRHAEALEVFQRYGIRASGQALALLGYKVRWSGLDLEGAEILKI